MNCNDSRSKEEQFIEPVRQWVYKMVIGLNLCPFAKREWQRNRIRFQLSDADTEQDLLEDLERELLLLKQDDSVETTLLIHPHILNDFFDYNDFLNVADNLIKLLKLEGVIQIASFHPDYQFAETEFNAVENFTNRSPFPLLHLIREATMDTVLENFPDPDSIPERNIALLHELGEQKIQALLRSCSLPSTHPDESN